MLIKLKCVTHNHSGQCCPASKYYSILIFSDNLTNNTRHLKYVASICNTVLFLMNMLYRKSTMVIGNVILTERPASGLQWNISLRIYYLILHHVNGSLS